MEKLNEEQLEIEEQRQAKAIIRNSIQAGKDLDKLRKTPEFQRLIEVMFIQQGKDILWQNTIHLTEEQLKGRGNDNNLKMIEALKGQVKSRLDLEGFFDTVESDYLNAIEEIDEQKED